ncbi:MAG: hypothetical protein LBL46_00270 [Rickettsiales bacterium]|nr:hypothetical protein [Rickettsiales bacterium]
MKRSFLFLTAFAAFCNAATAEELEIGGADLMSCIRKYSSELSSFGVRSSTRAQAAPVETPVSNASPTVTEIAAPSFGYGPILLKEFDAGATVVCKAENFGNIPGRLCYVASTKLADENGNFVMDKVGRVLYGTNNSGFARSFAANETVSCNAATFGDPAPGAAKSCRTIEFAADKDGSFVMEKTGFVVYGNIAEKSN